MFKSLMSKVKGVLQKMGIVKIVKQLSDIKNIPVSGVNFNFFATHEHQTIKLNGYIPLTFEEYSLICSDLESLKDKVKEKVIESLVGKRSRIDFLLCLEGICGNSKITIGAKYS
ncbi:hypothetical protein [Niallia circulans]|uniref:hypothetical protein n=1 Tax=Niallia circulans TaxID=1397 RepID=UPI00201E2594|nr:hypothetical protein [Niallia circulans]